MTNLHYRQREWFVLLLLTNIPQFPHDFSKQQYAMRFVL